MNRLISNGKNTNNKEDNIIISIVSIECDNDDHATFGVTGD